MKRSIILGAAKEMRGYCTSETSSHMLFYIIQTWQITSLREKCPEVQMTQDWVTQSIKQIL